jgi:ribose transport system ATP-binding protein
MPEISGGLSPLILMQGINKGFPGVKALKNVDFELLPGEIHMLLGENGAGKSTLIKILSGAYIADEGSIEICGETVDLGSPHAAIERGVRSIYQEINLVQELDIARNLFLGEEPLKSKKFGIVDQKSLYSRSAEYLKRFHIDLDPREQVGNLSVTQQKMVEIARALVSDVKVLVLDEPTDVLEDRSRQDLFDLIHRLKADGVGFIYISHRYAEVHELGDRVTILRDGENAGTYEIGEITLDEMINLMIGRKVEKQYPELKAPQEDNALQVDNIKQSRKLNGISLSVKQGEIVSITGLMGAGKTELGRAIAGIDPIDSGKVFVQGNRANIANPERAIRSGISYLTEDRKTLGLVLDHSIRDNYALPNAPRLTKFGFLRHKAVEKEAQSYMDRLKIKAPGLNTYARQLSGGNQQKAVLAKWLGTRSRVIIFDEPTRGIDINGRREVYKIMQELLDDGVGILMLTSDYAEALEMGHRIIVMHRGTIAREFSRGEASEEDILRVAVGAGKEK